MYYRDYFILGDPGTVSQAGKRCDKSFQTQAEKPLGTDSHRSISKRSSECWLLIGHKKCFVLLCPIGEQHLLSSFREFVHDGYWLDHGLSGSCTETQKQNFLSAWIKLLLLIASETFFDSSFLRFWSGKLGVRTGQLWRDNNRRVRTYVMYTVFRFYLQKILNHYFFRI